MGGREPPKHPRGRAGQGRGSPAHSGHGRREGRGDVPGLPQLCGFCLFPRPFCWQWELEGLKGWEVPFGGLSWGERSSQCWIKLSPAPPAVFTPRK